MKLAIMQPYFFPYIGYFTLISLSDQFILFDTPQFIRHGWIERNKVLKPNGEPLYIKVPLQKHSRHTSIKETIIRDENWKEKILAQLTPYKKKAPYYNDTISVIMESWDIETKSITKLNKHTLNTICEYLNIKTPITIWSEMGININNVNEADEWALKICKRMGADTYYNAIGGQNFFNVKKYIDQGINIHFVKSIPIEYRQFGNNFAPFLSIIDVMMFNSVADSRKMIENHELV